MKITVFVKEYLNLVPPAVVQRMPEVSTSVTCLVQSNARIRIEACVQGTNHDVIH